MADPRLQALFDQLETLLLILERPVVQRQLLAFLLIFLGSWLLPAPLGTLLNRMIARQSAISHRRHEEGLPANLWRARFLRWARGAQLLLFPVVGLVMSQLTIGYFAGQAWPLGLLEQLAALFWLVLGYRLIGSILYAALPAETANRYHGRFVRPIFTILIALVVTTGLAGAFPIFGIELFQLMGTPLTLRTLALAAVVVYVALAASWITDDMLKHVVLPRAQATVGVSSTIQVVARYAIIAMGALAALSTLGVDLSALAIIGGGLSVGIGFGLQELVANFISGILLLFEQTLRPGDVIEVGGQRGTVSQLRMRATVLRTIDNVEVFVPNKTLLTSTVATYTHTDRTIRRVIRIGVSYKSDPRQVRDLLQSIVDSHGVILKDPAPTVFFVAFGPSSLDFEIAIWIGDPARTMQILNDLHFMIFNEFAKHGIEIPYPQSDVHIRSADPRLWGPPAAHDATPHAVHDGTRDDAHSQTPATERVKAPAEKPRLPG